MVYLEIKLRYFILFTCHTITEIQKIKDKWKKRSGAGVVTETIQSL